MEFQPNFVLPGDYEWEEGMYDGLFDEDEERDTDEDD